VKIFILLKILFLLQLSCVSVNIELRPNPGRSTSFIHYSHYGVLGLIGSSSIDMQLACMEGEPIRIKNYFTFEDILFIITTAGLYFPKSTEMWCELPDQDPPIQF